MNKYALGGVFDDAKAAVASAEEIRRRRQAADQRSHLRRLEGIRRRMRSGE